MPDYAIDVVARAVRALEVLADRDGSGLPEVSREIGASKAATFRLLRTLLELDMVVQHPDTKRYRLGPRLIALGHRAAEATDVLEAGAAELEALVARFQIVATVNLRTYDAVIEARRLPRAVAREAIPLGAPLPFHACASGIVFLADDPDLRVRIADGPLERFASRTPTTARELGKRIDDYRRVGYVVARDTLEEGVSAVSVPIVDASGGIAATLGATAPSGGLRDGEWEELAAELLSAAARVSHGIGGRVPD